MNVKRIADNVYSIGVLNPNLRIFDIVMETAYGTSYNSYLVKGKECSALIETVHLDFFDDYIENIKEIEQLENIKYLIMNHNEPDHSGSIKKLMEILPDLKIVVSQAGSIYLKNIVNSDKMDIIVAKDGTNIDLGGKTLNFINAPFLHWPDSMFTYLKEDKLLFTCDFFGAHYCEPMVFDSRIKNKQIYLDSLKGYYDAIFGPFRPYVVKGLEKIKEIEFDLAATSHGPVLTKDNLLPQVIELYKEWSKEPVHENKLIPIFYCSAYQNTEKIAEEIAKGIKEKITSANVQIYDIIKNDMSHLSNLLNQSDAFLIGSPTINKDAVPPIWILLSHIDAINIQKKPVAIFGSYGWSGEAFKNIRSRLSDLKLNVFENDFKVQFVPNEEELKKARQFGIDFATSL